MEKIEYLFVTHGNVRASVRYAPGAFGFVAETERRTQPDLGIYELSDGFRLPYWYVGEDITTVEQDDESCYLDSDACVQHLWEKDGFTPKGVRFVPLCFKADLPQEGNYRVTVEARGATQGRKAVQGIHAERIGRHPGGCQSRAPQARPGRGHYRALPHPDPRCSGACAGANAVSGW